jgi:hypothetical protein
VVAVVVQQITLVWTKPSRGGPAAVARNRLPRAYTMVLSDAAFVYQRHSITQDRGVFDRRIVEEYSAATVPRTARDLTLSLTSAGLRVDLRWTAHMGMPPRRPKTPALELRLGEYGRVVTNGRHTSHDDQHYTRDIYNIAVCQDFTEDAFTALEPLKVCDFEANLF